MNEDNRDIGYAEMMVRDQYKALALGFIKQERYAKARQILLLIPDDPVAKGWLEKLDIIEAQSSIRSLVIACINIIAAVACLFAFVMSLNGLLTRDPATLFYVAAYFFFGASRSMMLKWKP